MFLSLALLRHSGFLTDKVYATGRVVYAASTYAMRAG